MVSKTQTIKAPSGRLASRRLSRTNTRGQQSKETILDIAERHFAQFGYRGVSTAAIASDAGISDPGLLHHFGSKEGLLNALLEQRFSFDATKLKEDERLGRAELLTLISDTVTENLGRAVGVRLMTVLLGEALSDHHPSHDFFRQRYTHVRALLAKHVQSGQNAGEIRTDIPAEHLASALMAIMDGLQIQWLLNGTDMAGVARTLMALFDAALDPQR